jgi:hypothetical protein
MAKSRPSVQKRINESRKLEKNQAKALRKAARSAQREERSGIEGEAGVDPDLAGITAGPQPVVEDPLSRLPVEEEA